MDAQVLLGAPRYVRPVVPVLSRPCPRSPPDSLEVVQRGHEEEEDRVDGAFLPLLFFPECCTRRTDCCAV